jgi:hypothetical protein
VPTGITVMAVGIGILLLILIVFGRGDKGKR